MKPRIHTWATLFTLLFALIIAPLAGFSQINTTPGSADSFVGGIFYAPRYAGTWNVYIANGNAATGSQTITLTSGSVTLRDGRTIVPFAVNVPITINDANQETVTITAVQNCIKGPSIDPNSPSNGIACQVTASFSNLHGAGAMISSGDNGYLEAVNDAGNNGGGAVYWVNSTGPLTLATGGATTTYSQTNFFPVNAIVLGVVARVTTTITGCSSGWEVGDGTTAARFVAVNATLTAGTVSTNTGTYQTTGIASATTGMKIGADKQAVITCTGSNATAGALEVRSFGWTPVAPNY